jgi:hypothetical protein
MSRHKTARLARVISGALRVWGVPASVEFDPDQPDALVLRTPSGTTLQVIAADAPHGWRVCREALPIGSPAGLPGLLRALRDELAPEAARGRLVIGSQILS